MQRSSVKQNLRPCEKDERSPMANQPMQVRHKTAYTKTTLAPSSGTAAAQPAPRMNRVKSLNSQDWGMPIAACAGATRLNGSPMGIRRNAGQRPFLPRVARLANRTSGMTAAVVSVAGKQRGGGGVRVLDGGGNSNSSVSPGGDMQPMTAAQRRKIKLAKAFRLPDQQNKSFVYLCKPVKKVKELLTVRRIRNSSEELGKQQQQPAPPMPTPEQKKHHKEVQVQAAAEGEAEEEEDNSGAEEYALAPLMEPSSSSATSFGFNAQPSESALGRPLRQQVLQRRQHELCGSLSTTSFHGMLHSQLQDIRKREHMLKSALYAFVDNKTASRPEQAPAMGAQVPMVQMDAAQRKVEIDFVFKNMPTLQREIRMLQQIGEKLEGMLSGTSNSNESQSSGHRLERQCSSVYYTPRTSPSNGNSSSDVVLVRCFGCRRLEQQALMRQRVRMCGRICSYGFVREYRIETKTLTELKTADESQCFYLPASGHHSGDMRRTSFRKLKENPKVLLQQLRPVTPARRFNLLEQDAMFFNSVAFGDQPRSSSSDHGADRLSYGQPYARLFKPPLCAISTLLDGRASDHSRQRSISLAPEAETARAASSNGSAPDLQQHQQQQEQQQSKSDSKARLSGGRSASSPRAPQQWPPQR